MFKCFPYFIFVQKKIQELQIIKIIVWLLLFHLRQGVVVGRMEDTRFLLTSYHNPIILMSLSFSLSTRTKGVRRLTLRTQDILALYVWCRSVSDCSALKCMKHLWMELKHASSVAIVQRNVSPLYNRYSNGMEVLGKRLSKAVSEAVSYVWAVSWQWT